MPSVDLLTSVRQSLETIADSLEEAEFIIPRPGRRDAERSRIAVIETIRKYLLHRLREPDAPVVAALVGLSGVGKSTVLNSLAQEPISATGVVRPTTTGGVLWAHRDHAARYWTEFVGRVTDQIGPTTDVVIGDDSLTRHLTFIDTPPLEMTLQGSATSAAETLMFADICVYVTSTGRYADAAPLAFLEAARSRGIPILFVLNRLPEDDEFRRELLADYASKLVSARLLPESDPAFIFGVPEVEHLRWHGGLPAEAVASLRKELSEVSDPDFRIVVIDEAAESTVRAMAEQAGSLASDLKDEAALRRELRDVATGIYDSATAKFVHDVASGKYAQLAESKDWSEVSLELAGAMTGAEGRAAGETAGAWLERPHAVGLIDPGHEGLRRHGPVAAKANASELDGWHDGLGELVSAAYRWRPRRRRVRRAVRDLWRTVIDPEFMSRRWRRGRTSTIDVARDRFAGAVARALANDRERFSRRLSADIDASLPEAVLEAAQYLAEMSPDLPADAVSEGSSHGL